MILSGTIHRDFVDVARALLEQIPERAGGAALTVVHRGETVIDVWGGTRDDEGSPWTRDTLALSFSTTKGVSSTLLHILASQGRIDHDAPVARYWPAFGQSGKGGITVRHVLSHEAGLWAIRDLVDDAAQMRDWAGMLERIERARPAHPPGRRSGYHGLTYGWLVGGLIEKVTGKPFAQVLADELSGPLGLDGCYVGLPADAMVRRATLVGLKVARGPRPPRRRSLRGRAATAVARPLLALAGLDLKNFRRGLLPRGIGSFDWNAAETAQACIPAAAGMFTSRSLARIYAMLAGGGQIDGVRLISPEVMKKLSEVQSRRLDDVLFFPMHWRLGYHRVAGLGRGGSSAFGHFGFGGSGAWCDPSRQIAAAMTLNSGVGTPMGDFRIWTLNRAISDAVERRDGRRQR